MTGWLSISAFSWSVGEDAVGDCLGWLWFPSASELMTKQMCGQGSQLCLSGGEGCLVSKSNQFLDLGCNIYHGGDSMQTRHWHLGCSADAIAVVKHTTSCTELWTESFQLKPVQVPGTWQPDSLVGASVGKRGSSFGVRPHSGPREIRKPCLRRKSALKLAEESNNYSEGRCLTPGLGIERFALLNNSLQYPLKKQAP